MKMKFLHRYSRRKLYISAAVYYTGFVFGCVLNIFSPLVIAFSQIFHTDVPSVSVIFTIMNVSYLFSALTSALVYRYLNRHACLISLISLVSLLMLVIPHVTTIQIFYLVGGLIGLSSGGCDTALITWIIELWREEAAPFILTQHFAYSLGTIVPPVILSNFLSDQVGHNVTSSPSFVPDESNLDIPFTILGALMASSTLVHIILFYRLPEPPKGGEDKESLLESESSSTSETQSELVRRRMIILVILSCFVIGFYSALEMTTMQFFPTFCAYSQLALSQADGAQILFGLTLAFAFGRFMGILIVVKIPPQIILWVNFGLIFISNFLLFNWGGGSIGFLWVGSVLLGLGMSTVYPSFYAYIERHVHITSFIVACISVSGGFLAATYPLIVANYVKDNPKVLNHVIFFSLFIIVTCFGLTHWLTRSRGMGNKIM